MDLLSPGAILKQLSLGVAFGPDALHLSLLSSHWERVRRVDAETIDGFQAMPPTRRRRRVQAFLERNRAAHCSVVVSLPRREVLLRQPGAAPGGPGQPGQGGGIPTGPPAALRGAGGGHRHPGGTGGLRPPPAAGHPLRGAAVHPGPHPGLLPATGPFPRPHPARGGGPGRLPEGQPAQGRGGSQPGGSTGPAPGGAGRAGAGPTEALQGIPLRLFQPGRSPAKRSRALSGRGRSGRGGPAAALPGRPWRAPVPIGEAAAVPRPSPARTLRPRSRPGPPGRRRLAGPGGGLLRLQAQGGPGGQPAARRPASPQIALGMGPHLRPGRPQRSCCCWRCCCRGRCSSGPGPSE